MPTNFSLNLAPVKIKFELGAEFGSDFGADFVDEFVAEFRCRIGCEKLIKKSGVRGDNFARRATDTLRLFSGPGGVWGGGAPLSYPRTAGTRGGVWGGAALPAFSLMRNVLRAESTKNRRLV